MWQTRGRKNLIHSRKFKIFVTSWISTNIHCKTNAPFAGSDLFYRCLKKRSYTFDEYWLNRVCNKMCIGWHCYVSKQHALCLLISHLHQFSHQIADHNNNRWNPFLDKSPTSQMKCIKLHCTVKYYGITIPLRSIVASEIGALIYQFSSETIYLV